MNTEPAEAIQPSASDSPAAGPTAKADPRSETAQRTSGWLLFGERYGLVFVLVLVIAIFSMIDSSTFPTVSNWRDIGSTQSVTVVLGLAFILPLVGGNFDLSIGANAIMSSVACAACMSRYGWPLAAAIGVSIGLGLVVGVFNGILVTRARLNGLIATIGTAALLQGVVTWYSSGVPIASGISQTLENVGTKTTFGVPQLVWVAVVAAAIVTYVLTQTPYGRRLASIGSNRNAARLVGVRVNALTMGSFVVAGGIAGLAGVLIVAQQGSANPATDGIATLLPALTVAFLGASAFSPGEFNVPGLVVAVLLIAVLVSGLTLGGAADWVQPVCNGVALIVGVGLSAYFRGRRLGGAEV
jgi:ribose transport system permease protein